MSEENEANKGLAKALVRNRVSVGAIAMARMLLGVTITFLIGFNAYSIREHTRLDYKRQVMARELTSTRVNLLLLFC